MEIVSVGYTKVSKIGDFGKSTLANGIAERMFYDITIASDGHVKAFI